MYESKKLLIITSPICFVLSGLAICLCIINPYFQINALNIVLIILIGIWVFFLFPSILSAFDWIKKFLEKLSFGQSFLLGYILGFSGAILIFLLYLIISPITGLFWFVKTIKEIKRRRL